MTARELMVACDHAFLFVSRDDPDLVVEVLFPEEHPVPPELPPLLKQHKQELLALLTYQVTADELLLESTRRLASEWPAGCILDGPEWEVLENALTAAYWKENLEALRAALTERDAFALDMFDIYRVEHVARTARLYTPLHSERRQCDERPHRRPHGDTTGA